MAPIAIGIDLGTTYSLVAVYRDGRSEIIQNDQGNRLMPSCVGFNEIERFVGDEAKLHIDSNSENTIYGIKRVIGREFNEKSVQEDLQKFPFNIIEDDGKIKVKVTFKNETKLYFPQEISAMVLERLKHSAEDYVGEKIEDVVITCPAYFNDSQRQATIDAAKIAGLKVIRVISEPTAAALAYGIHKNDANEKVVLVFDFGGGTCDVSIVTIKGQEYTVKVTKGDTHLGGEDIDNRMVEHFTKEFKRKFGIDISDNKKLMSTLKTICESTKRNLSKLNRLEIKLPGTDLKGLMTRLCLEELCVDIFEKSMNLVEEALKDANLTQKDIDEVVLVGGSSRIPKVQELLMKIFDGKNLCKATNPDEAVALGAAIQAAMLQDQLSKSMKGIILADVCALSIGTRIVDGTMCPVIKRNTLIPFKTSQIFRTVVDNQPKVNIKIYEGERLLAENNHFLGNFILDNLKPLPRGSAIEETYEIDANGILTVTAVEQETGQQKQLRIENNSRLSEQEAEEIVQRAARLRYQDEIHRRQADVWNDFEIYLHETKKKIDCFPKKKFPLAKFKIDKIIDWLHENTKATEEDIIQKRKEVDMLIKS